MVGVEPVDEAPIELYTKLRKTRAIKMDVMQKLQIGKLSNLAYNIYLSLLVPISLYYFYILSYRFKNTIIFKHGVLICKIWSYQRKIVKWDEILHDIFQIKIEFVVFATDH